MARKRKSTGTSTRDLGISGNGKGDKSRVTDVKAYRANFDEINWKSPSTCVHAASAARSHSRGSSDS